MHSSLEWVSKQRILKFWSIELPPFGDINDVLSRKWYLRILKNRYFRATMIFTNILLGTAIVYSWQPFSGMLYATNVYSWNCSASEKEAHNKSILLNKENRFNSICSSQYNSIQLLYNLYTGSEFLVGAIAGLSFDYIGPFLTCLIGQLLLFLGIILLATSNQSFPLFAPAIILIGSSANFIVIPALAISDYFFKWESLLISLVITFQNGGSMVTTCLDQVFRNSNITFKSLFLGYLFFFLLPSGLLALLSTPLIRILSYRDELIKTKKSPQHNENDKSRVSNVFDIFPVDPVDDLDFIASDYELEKFEKTAVSPASSKQKHRSLPEQMILSPENPLFGVKMKTPQELLNNHVIETSTTPPSSCKDNVSLLSRNLRRKTFQENSVSALEQYSSPLSKHKCQKEQQSQNFFADLARTYSMASSIYLSKNFDAEFALSQVSDYGTRSPEKICSVIFSTKFLLFVPIVILSTLQYNYYPLILRSVSGGDVAVFNGFFFPTQAVWGVFYALLVVYTKTIPIVYWLIFLAGVLYAFILTSVNALHYIATILFVIGTTYIYSIKFTFVAEEFPPQHNGTLVGILGIASGLTLALNYLLVYLKNIKKIIIALEGSVVVTFILTIILHAWTIQLRRK